MSIAIKRMIPSQVAMTNPIYAIGDIHGQLAELHRAMALIEADGGQDAKIVFLGDYTDRGPDSRGVIEFLMEGQAQGRNWTLLKGNHDDMFWKFMQIPPQHEPFLPAELHWLHPRLGGDTTLGSYGVDADGKRRMIHIHADALEAVPQSHVDFLNKLQMSFETENLFFAHAGIIPGVALNEQSDFDLMWVRQEFHNHQDLHPKIIVHGHTPVSQATHYGNRVNLDSGAGYGKPLTAAVFENDAVYRLTPTGRDALIPLHLAE